MKSALYVCFFLCLAVSNISFGAGGDKGALLLERIKKLGKVMEAAEGDAVAANIAKEKPLDAMAMGETMGYVSGIAESMFFQQSKGGTPYLLPSEVTPFQIMNAVAHYLEAHPEKLEEGSFKVIMAAVIEAYPTKK